jgi:electron transfer flavoprotein beta subunit
MLVACLKWVDLRPEIDPLTGAVADDPRFFGLSSADRAALEWALRLGEAWSAPVLALSAGPPAAEGGLREALACGAARALRLPLPDEAPSAMVAAALAAGVQEAGGASVVCCGDRSGDRGSGSVPAYLAAYLGAVQALGLVTVDVDAVATPSDGLVVERRLDRGRRERLRLQVPAVVSLEGASARLRRAGLPGVLAARRRAIEVADGGAGGRPGAEDPPTLLRSGGSLAGVVRVEHRGPFRPRPRAQPAPNPAASPRDRILDLIGATTDRTPPRTVQASPEEAAHIIVDQLRSWGYVE